MEFRSFNIMSMCRRLGQTSFSELAEALFNHASVSTLANGIRTLKTEEGSSALKGLCSHSHCLRIILLRTAALPLQHLRQLRLFRGQQLLSYSISNASPLRDPLILLMWINDVYSASVTPMQTLLPVMISDKWEIYKWYKDPVPLKCSDYGQWFSSVPRRPWASKKEAMAAWGQRFWWWTYAGAVPIITRVASKLFFILPPPEVLFGISFTYGRTWLTPWRFFT